jgi:release factor glutamine methyltransferase
VTALEKLNEVARLFADAGIEDATREAALLIIETLGINKNILHASPPEIDNTLSAKIDSLARRRIKGEPIQYIIGQVEFYDLKIKVGNGVLIPRPETELLVEEAVKIIKNVSRVRQPSSVTDTENVSRSLNTDTGYGSRFSILDLCTGSGCIALALAKQFPESTLLGMDRSSLALSYAKQNAELNQIKNVSFAEGDLFEGIDPDARLSCIVSNPPYIRRQDIPLLQKEIAYEPVEALDGGEDGLNFYRRILKEAPAHLEEKGFVILEIGIDQSSDIRELATEAGFSDIRFVKDYAGIERIFVATAS